MRKRTHEDSSPWPMRLLAGGLVLVIAVSLAVTFVSRRNTATVLVSPEEDVLLSYLHVAHGLASELAKMKTPTEFQGNQKNFDGYCEQAASFQKSLRNLSDEDRRLAAQTHAEFVEQTTTACKQLEQQHAKNPKIIGDQWDRYWEALQFRELIESK